MPYRTRSELPEGVQNVLSKHAQDIYKEPSTVHTSSTTHRRKDGAAPAKKKLPTAWHGRPLKRRDTRKARMRNGIVIVSESVGDLLFRVAAIDDTRDNFALAGREFVRAKRALDRYILLVGLADSTNIFTNNEEVE